MESVQPLNAGSTVWRPNPDQRALRRLFSEYGVDSRSDLAMHSGDDMFRFTLEEACGGIDLAVFYYFRSALLARERINQVVEWWRRETGETPDILDFASGFGRVARFLAADHGRDRLTVAEIVGPAVEFQRQQLGLRAVTSTSVPGSLRLPGKYDLIVVLSLFSHLPPSTFDRWLATLAAHLTPRGVLLVSTNAARDSASQPIEFESQSESSFLSGEEYGTTWVQESFFRQAVGESCGQGFRAARFPKALWSLQDLWVITADERLDLALLSLERGPIGFLDGGGLTGDGSLVLSGWAAADPPRSPSVVVGFDASGEAIVDAGRPRPDVAAFLGRDDEGHGWHATAPRLPWAPDTLVSITVADHRARFLVHAGTVDETLLWIRAKSAIDRQRSLERDVRGLVGDLDAARRSETVLGARVADLEEAVRVMRLSRFWKARDAWWALKGRVHRRRD